MSSPRRTIDISGDGANTSGRSITHARDEAVRGGISINGLPILSLDPFLDRYYYNHVIGGPGAFMIPAANYENFADAVVKKLILEIASNEDGTRHEAMGRGPGQPAVKAPEPLPCRRGARLRCAFRRAPISRSATA